MIGACTRDPEGLPLQVGKADGLRLDQAAGNPQRIVPGHLRVAARRGSRRGGVALVQAIDVLQQDAVGIEAPGQEQRGVVGAAAPEQDGTILPVVGDESGHHDRGDGAEGLLQQRRVEIVRLGVQRVAVGAQRELLGWQQPRRNPVR